MIPATLRSPLALGVVAAIGLAAGCSSGRIPLRGTVTLDGAPVEIGTIALLPETDDPSLPVASAPIQAGKFSFTDKNGPNRGPYRVEIRWPKATGRWVKMEGTGDTIQELADAIPAKYNKASTLRLDVATDGKPVAFDLTTK
jgi:hypothetical protein